MKDLVTIVNQFHNGEERFRTDPLFNTVCQYLARGATEVDMIDFLFGTIKGYKDFIEDHAKTCLGSLNIIVK